MKLQRLDLTPPEAMLLLFSLMSTIESLTKRKAKREVEKAEKLLSKIEALEVI